MAKIYWKDAPHKEVAEILVDARDVYGSLERVARFATEAMFVSYLNSRVGTTFEGALPLKGRAQNFVIDTATRIAREQRSQRATEGGIDEDRR